MKQKRYWFIGGLIGLAILALSVGVHWILWLLNIPVEITDVLIVAKPFMIITGVIIGFVAKMFHLPKDILNIFLANNIILIMIVVNTVAYFLVGGLVGWIYGLIKNKNKAIQ